MNLIKVNTFIIFLVHNLWQVLIFGDTFIYQSTPSNLYINK